MSDIATTLWPDLPVERAREAAPAPTPGNNPTLAERMFPTPEPVKPVDGVPANIQQLRDDDTLRKFWGADVTYGHVVSTEDFRAPNVTEEAAQARASEMREVLNDLQLGHQEAKKFVSVLKKYTDTPPDDATRALWRKESSERLVEFHGGNIEAANRDLARAQTLVARDPRVKAMLATIGDEPSVMRILVHAARNLALKGAK